VARNNLFRSCAQLALALTAWGFGLLPATAVEAYRVRHNCYDSFSPADVIREEAKKGGRFAFAEDDVRGFVLDLECDCTLGGQAMRQLQILLDAKLGEEPLNPYVWVAGAEFQVKLFIARQGRWAIPFEVVRMAQRAAELNPPLGRASLALAKTDLLTGDVFNAMQHLDDARKLGAPHDEVLLAKASIARVMNNEREARGALEEVIRSSPAVELKAAAGIALGELFEKQGKPDDAERAYRAAAALRSCTRIPDRQLATLLIFAKNHPAEAKAVLVRVNSPRPDAQTSRLLEILEFFAWSADSMPPLSKNEAVQSLLQQSEVSAEEILFTAARFDSGRKLILDLFAGGVLQNVDAVDGRSNTALLIAAAGNAGGVAEALILRGARVNAQNAVGERAIGLFAVHGNVDAMKLLLQKGAELNYVDSGGNSPIRAAVAGSQAEAVKLLLQSGAKANVSELLAQAALSGNLAMVRMLVAAGGNVNSQAPKTIPPLLAGVLSGDLPTIRYLLEKNADPAAKYGGRSILEYARDAGNPALIRLLMEKTKVPL
jgi:tetratricopeptide (TPR) repeat protein